MSAPPVEAGPVRGSQVAGVPAETLAERFGTPLYVYDLDAI